MWLSLDCHCTSRADILNCKSCFFKYNVFLMCCLYPLNIKKALNKKVGQLVLFEGGSGWMWEWGGGV